MPDIGPDQFKCAQCGGVFDKGWTDAEAATEYDIEFAHVPDASECVVICDDCYNDFMRRLHPNRSSQ